MRDLVSEGADHSAGPGIVKVIIESGELPDQAAIDRATHFAIAHGADFVKTSTGKTPVSATPEAAEIILEAIELSGMPVGFKASGGIRTVADARVYLELAERIMGDGMDLARHVPLRCQRACSTTSSPLHSAEADPPDGGEGACGAPVRCRTFGADRAA